MDICSVEMQSTVRTNVFTAVQLKNAVDVDLCKGSWHTTVIYSHYTCCLIAVWDDKSADLREHFHIFERFVLSKLLAIVLIHVSIWCHVYYINCKCQIYGSVIQNGSNKNYKIVNY